MTFPSRRLTLGLGLAAACAVAVWSSFDRGESVEPGLVNAVAPPDRPTPIPWFSQRAVTPRPLPPTDETLRGSPAAPSEVVGDPDITQSAAAGSIAMVRFEPTREELEVRALMVEQQANRQLKNLLGVLRLTEAQQDRIFSTFARRSDYYHPALQFQGADGNALPGEQPSASTAPKTTPTPAADAPTTPSPGTAEPASDPILAELEPEQLEAYERYRSERDSFWAGVLNDIEQKLSTNGR